MDSDGGGVMLKSLIAKRDRAEARAKKADSEVVLAKAAIRTWANKQIEAALAKRGITPRKSIVRMKVRKMKHNRISFVEETCLLRFVGEAQPAGDLEARGTHWEKPRAQWWVRVHWQSVRKTDGKPGAFYDDFLMHGDTPAAIAAQIEHVRDLE